jgi:hypothetical protein
VAFDFAPRQAVHRASARHYLHAGWKKKKGTVKKKEDPIYML